MLRGGASSNMKLRKVWPTGPGMQADRPDWRGEVEYRFRGPQILVEAGF